MLLIQWFHVRQEERVECPLNVFNKSYENIKEITESIIKIIPEKKSYKIYSSSSLESEKCVVFDVFNLNNQ